MSLFDRHEIEEPFRLHMGLSPEDHMILRIDAQHYFMKEVKKFSRNTRDMLMRSRYFSAWWIEKCLKIEELIVYGDFEYLLGEDGEKQWYQCTDMDYIVLLNNYIGEDKLQGEVESVLMTSFTQFKTNKNKAPKVKYSWQKR